MLRYIARRLIWGVVILIVVCALTFILFRVLPTANPAILRAGRDPQPRLIKEIEQVLGVNKPLIVQFWEYLKQVFFHFNLGYSWYSDAPVSELIFERLPATLSLCLGGAILWVVVGLGVGIISALRRGKLADRAAMVGALVAISAPTFWLGIVALYLFAAEIGRFPIFPGAGSYVSFTQNPAKWFGSLILPWLVVAASSAAVFARLMRGNLSETMGEDYIRTARAKGLPEHSVTRQGVRAAINPAFTAFGLELGFLLGGALLIEIVFNIPGVGLLNYHAIRSSDFPVVQGTVLLAAMFIVLMNIVVDVAYAYLDPRVRFS
ncbi:MAG TPA: ABC transporter permease [Solirubrobacteraceae bacterium]|nr:ABC transporter permease [Solirubrobacteraceae bacterium]